MLHDLGARDLLSAIGRAVASEQDRDGEDAARDGGQTGACRRRARRAGIHAERRRNGVRPGGRRASRRTMTDGVSRRSTSLSRPTRGSRARSTRSSRCTRSTGSRYPDTPTMALHRGRIDLLEQHIQRDPSVLNRTFTHREIYPSEMGCRDGDRRDRRHATRRHDAAAHVRRLRRARDRAVAHLDKGRTSTRSRRWARAASADTRRCSARSCRSRTSG